MFELTMVVSHVKESWMEGPGNLVAHIRPAPAYYRLKDIQVAWLCVVGGGGYVCVCVCLSLCMIESLLLAGWCSGTTVVYFQRLPHHSN